MNATESKSICLLRRVERGEWKETCGGREGEARGVEREEWRERR